MSKDTKVRADQILYALSKKHAEDVFFAGVKSGATHTNPELLIMDAIAIKKSWASPCISTYEVKVSRSDFLRDNKWQGYLPLCHRFYFACPTGLIQPDELPEEVGLVWYNPDTGALTTKRKAVHRLIEPPAPMYYYLIMSRLENDRHPFHNPRQEFFKAWVQDREDGKRLGYQVANKLVKTLLGQLGQIGEQQREIANLKARLAEAEGVRGVLEGMGIETGRWGWTEKLKRRLEVTVPPEVMGQLEGARRCIEYVEKLIRPAEEGAQ